MIFVLFHISVGIVCIASSHRRILFFFVLFVCNIEFVVSLKKTALKVFVLLLYACIFFSGESFRNQKTVRKIVAKYCPKIAVTFPTMQ